MSMNQGFYTQYLIYAEIVVKFAENFRICHSSSRFGRHLVIKYWALWLTSQ